MSSAHVGPRLAASALPGPRHLATEALRVRRAQGWAVGVLAVATTCLLGYVVLLLAAVSLAGTALQAVGRRDLPPVDLSSVAADVLPGLLVGWCLGLAATTVLARGEALSPRAAGLVSGRGRRHGRRRGPRAHRHPLTDRLRASCTRFRTRIACENRV